MRKILFAGFICVLFIGSVFAQKAKPWTEWSKKDADKILNDSAWAQSITRGEAPPTIDRDANSGRSQTNNGPSSVTLSTEFNYRIRLASAKPIREGFARRIVLSQPEKASELTTQLQGIIDRGFGDFIIVAVNVDGQEPRAYAPYLQGLSKMTTAMVSERAYLERKDGKRLPLLEYRAPSGDGMGGKFIFARTLDGAPFLAPDRDSVRFVFNVSDKMKIDVKFKVSGMIYGEKLEY